MCIQVLCPILTPCQIITPPPPIIGRFGGRGGIRIRQGVNNLAGGQNWAQQVLSLRRRGQVKQNPLQYFEFGLQYLVQPLSVNATYSTFKFACILYICITCILLYLII